MRLDGLCERGQKLDVAAMTRLALVAAQSLGLLAKQHVVGSPLRRVDGGVAGVGSAQPTVRHRHLHHDLPAHKTQEVRDALEAVGALYFYLPPYTGSMNG